MYLDIKRSKNLFDKICTLPPSEKYNTINIIYCESHNHELYNI